MTMDECVSVFKLKIQITVYPFRNQHIKAVNNEEKIIIIMIKKTY